MLLLAAAAAAAASKMYVTASPLLLLLLLFQELVFEMLQCDMRLAGLELPTGAQCMERLAAYRADISSSLGALHVVNPSTHTPQQQQQQQQGKVAFQRVSETPKTSDSGEASPSITHQG